MNADTPDRLARQLRAFAGHIRDPAGQPAPGGVEDRRMQIYRKLFFRNVENLLSSNFPVLRRIHGGTRWRRLVRDFYAEHRAHTPLFPELAKEFLRYLQDGRGQRDGDPPFLLELAHYEWVELALSLDPRELDGVAAKADGDLIDGIPVLSPLAWPLTYHFPVHRIGPDFQPTEPPPTATHLLVYRDRGDAVRFMQLNDVTLLLLQLMGEHPDWPGRRLLARVGERIGYDDPGALLTHGRTLFEDFRAREVVLGTQPPRDDH